MHCLTSTTTTRSCEWISSTARGEQWVLVAVSNSRESRDPHEPTHSKVALEGSLQDPKGAHRYGMVNGGPGDIWPSELGKRCVPLLDHLIIYPSLNKKDFKHQRKLVVSELHPRVSMTHGYSWGS